MAIVESIQEDYPDVDVQDWAILPAQAYQEEWVVSKDEKNVDDPANFEPQYYSVSMKGKDVSGQAVYNAKGELMHSKEIIKDGQLPSAITKKLATDYSGYQVTKDKEVIKDGKHHTEYYKIRVKKGKEKQTLYFGENGELMHGKHDQDKNS